MFTFPIHGCIKREQLETDILTREVARLKTEKVRSGYHLVKNK